MSIPIVTAFFDIGREDWGLRPGIPSWLSRSVDSYFECFERMCRLDNELVIYTEAKFCGRISSLRQKYGFQQKTHIFCPDIFANYSYELEVIARVMGQPGFLEGIVTPYCPEYWEPRYVLINYLKSAFVCQAIDSCDFTNKPVAWLDFGYCRNDLCLPESSNWDYPFSDKIHVFNILPIIQTTDLTHIIKTNTVYIQGCHIVAFPGKWRRLRELMRQSFDTLIRKGLIDDDQTMLLMSYLAAPDLFEAHTVDATKRGWFVILRDYNRASQS